MDISAKHRSKFVALHRQWWPLQMSENCSSGTSNSIQTNKQAVLINVIYLVYQTSDVNEAYIKSKVHIQYTKLYM